MKALKHTIVLVSIFALCTISSFGQGSFTNPLMQGADPQVVYHDGYYYMLVTRADRVGIKRSASLHNIHEYNEIVVWRFVNTPVGGHIWAPELHFVDGKWYIYTCGQNTGLAANPTSVPYVQEDQQMVLLESQSDDPLGPYKFKTWLLEGTGAIDETVFTHMDGKRYIIWSQFNNPGEPQTQCLYIAELINPWTIGEVRIRISCPEFAWEKNGWPVNEGAVVLEREGKTYVVYSGSGFTTAEYALGYLVNNDGDLLNADSWTKVGPVFQQNPEGGIYATGHNWFAKSPDGSEDWIVYHGRLSADGSQPRYIFIQKFFWQGDKPDFGTPVPLSEEIYVPSVNRGEISAVTPLNETALVISGERSDGSTTLWSINPDNAPYFREHATFMQVPGMADDTALSLEFLGYSGHYLVNNGGVPEIRPYDGTEQFRQAATFYEYEAFAGGEGYLSLESMIEPGAFLKRNGTDLLLGEMHADSLSAAREEASWYFSDAYRLFDCNGDYRGEAFIDSCGNCAGGNTGREPSLDKYDCPATNMVQSEKSALKIYPNPVQDFLQISIPDQVLEMDIRVSDFSGRMQMKTTSDNGRINLSGISDGMYLLQVTSGNSRYAALFVKIS